MRKAVKIVLMVVFGFIGIIFLGAIFSGPFVNHDISAITGIKQFVVLHDGSLYTTRFSLVDSENGQAASDAHLSYNICGVQGEVDITASDFKTYQLVLTGQPIVAYAWQMDDPEMDCDTYNANIVVTLPDGRWFEARKTAF